jgi:hypothetical protein
MFAAFALMFCRITITLVFALSASGKALDISSFQESISNFRLLPPGWSKAVAWTLLLAESTVVALMMIGGSMLTIGFSMAAGLLVAFSAALVVALRRNVVTTCNCFGRTEQRVTPYDVARNVLLILCSLTGIWALVEPPQSFSGADIVLVSFMAGCFVALLTNLRNVVETLRRPFSVG